MYFQSIIPGDTATPAYNHSIQGYSHSSSNSTQRHLLGIFIPYGFPGGSAWTTPGQTWDSAVGGGKIKIIGCVVKRIYDYNVGALSGHTTVSVNKASWWITGTGYKYRDWTPRVVEIRNNFLNKRNKTRFQQNPDGIAEEDTTFQDVGSWGWLYATWKGGGR